MRSIVIDSSAIVAYLLPDESTTQAEMDLIDASTLVAPALVAYEVLDAVSVAVTRKRLTEDEGQIAIRRFNDLVIDRDHDAPLDRIFMLTRRHTLTAYDAAYLELALRWGVPLLTRDTRLAAAARAEGVAA